VIGLNTYTFRPKIIILQQRNYEQLCYREIFDSIFFQDGPKHVCNSALECPLDIDIMRHVVVWSSTHLYVPTIHCGESALWGKCVRPSWSLWGTYYSVCVCVCECVIVNVTNY